MLFYILTLLFDLKSDFVSVLGDNLHSDDGLMPPARQRLGNEIIGLDEYFCDSSQVATKMSITKLQKHVKVEKVDVLSLYCIGLVNALMCRCYLLF